MNTLTFVGWGAQGVLFSWSNAAIIFVVVYTFAIQHVMYVTPLFFQCCVQGARTEGLGKRENTMDSVWSSYIPQNSRMMPNVYVRKPAAI